jgi:hypothetical protein
MLDVSLFKGSPLIVMDFVESLFAELENESVTAYEIYSV